MSAKTGIHELAALCAANGIHRAVLCPGSRCAPLTLAFTAHTAIQVYQVIDERSAAFFALGLSLASSQPVALICTSGSAVLNFGPALAEAFYADVPLVAITADRPEWKVGHQDGQAIRQPGVFDNYTKKSIHINGDFASDTEASQALVRIQQVLQQALYPSPGPVHINIAFDEPLYGLLPPHVALPPQAEAPPKRGLSRGEKEYLGALLKQYPRVCIAAGQSECPPELWQSLQNFASASGALIVAEALANLPPQAEAVFNANELLRTKPGTALPEPQLLISFGKGMVSRVWRRYIAAIPGLQHIHVDAGGREIDTYGRFKAVFSLDPQQFFADAAHIHNGSSETYAFSGQWMKASAALALKMRPLQDAQPYSDLRAYREVCSLLPPHINLHVANSMAVRYLNLMRDYLPAGINIYCNRGVSGIDGSSSTAAGFAACRSNEDVWLLTGDLAFQYDSNAFWHPWLSKRLRVVVFNNTGGGIFRVIDGPSQHPDRLHYFEAPLPSTAEPLARRAGAAYMAVSAIGDIQNGMDFLSTHTGSAAILEIFTPATENEKVFKHFIQQLTY